MLIDTVEGLSRRHKQAIAMVIDTAMLPLLLAASLVMRHGHWNLDWPQFWPAFAVTLVSVPLFAKIGLYRHIIRYMGSQALLVIVYGVAILAVLLLAVAFMVRLEDFPRTIPFIFGLLAFVYLVGTRFLVRFYADTVVRNDDARKPVAIYGSDDPGAYLAYRLVRDREYRPVAFIDDDPRHHGHASSTESGSTRSRPCRGSPTNTSSTRCSWSPPPHRRNGDASSKCSSRIRSTSA